MQEFAGKTVLVSGASSGIGKATALKFAAQGARVIATSKDQTRGAALLKSLREYSSDNHWIKADIMQPASIVELFERIVDNGWQLDIAFNNASTGGGADLLHKINWDDWSHTIEGTLTTVFQFMQKELEIMVKNGSGVIINNSSVDGLRAFPFDPAYSAAKHGVNGLTKSAAVQYAKQNIRINAICPGWVKTPPIENLLNQKQIQTDELLQHQPIGRFGTAEEIADSVLWLASDRASFVTGSIITLDGGYTAI